MTILGMRAEFDRYHVPMLVAAATGVDALAGVTRGWARVGMPRPAAVGAPSPVSASAVPGAAAH